MDNGRVKIGVSDNPEERIKNLMYQGGCLMQLRYKSHQIDNFAEIEHNLHSMFIDKRFVGEWFDIGCNEAINMVKRLVKNRHDCMIIKKFEDGMPIGEIARLNNVSRTAIVNYLFSKGYSPKDRQGKHMEKNIYKPAKPYKESSNIETSVLEKMVEINNKKIAEKRAKRKR